MSAKQVKDCNLYVYVSSIHPWTHRKLLNRLYCLMRTKKKAHGDIVIAPFEQYSNDPRARGVFVYKKGGKSNDPRKFFYDSVRELTRFLNYLACYCRHGFMEMDNYLYVENALNDNEIFDENKLPSVAVPAIAHEYTKPGMLRYMEEAMKNVDNLRLSSPSTSRIENALSLYRTSFFQLSEGVRYILQFTALESLVGNSKATLGGKLFGDIVKAVRKVCQDENLPSAEVNKICSRLGYLKQESIKNVIRNTLQRYHITRKGKEIDVNSLCNARNKFSHGGVEVDKLHRLSLVMDDVIPSLVDKLMKTHLTKTT